MCHSGDADTCHSGDSSTARTSIGTADPRRRRARHRQSRPVTAPTQPGSGQGPIIQASSSTVSPSARAVDRASSRELAGQVQPADTDTITDDLLTIPGNGCRDRTAAGGRRPAGGSGHGVRPRPRAVARPAGTAPPAISGRAVGGGGERRGAGPAPPASAPTWSRSLAAGC
jgi:hypothetical protein